MVARLLGPDASGRLVYTPSGGSLRVAAGKTAIVYAAASGSTLADIRAYDGTGTPGATISGSTLTVDDDSQLPLFWFPDGADQVWVSVAGGSRTAVDADNNLRLDGMLPRAGGSMSGALVLADGSLAASRSWASANASAAASANLPLFNVEQFGAVGDGVTDDYVAIRAAWDAMVASDGGYLFFPRAAVYRIVADGRLTVGPDGQYALFPIPHLTDITVSKRILGVLGVGMACVIRNFPGVGNAMAATVTSSVLQVDYSAPFAWHATNGLPSVIGARDYDRASGHSNVHFVVDHLTVRQPPDPSMCSINLEACSTSYIGDLYCDVSGALDDAPEPTHPTGAALLLPATGNAVAVKVQTFGAWGYYTGVPITEHSDVTSAIIVRCKIGAAIRRAASAHFAHITSLAMEQCPWGLAGYDPSAAGPNLGVVASPGWTVRIDFWDVEDFDYSATRNWMYPGADPVKAHIYDPNNALKGAANMARVDSGVLHEAQDTAYVTGASTFSLLKLSNPAQAVTRLTGGAPTNPTTLPDAPTIGAATAGDASATVAFTPAATGGAATSFRAISTPGSITGTATSSPIAVTGLTNGVSYTFTVRAQNGAGNSAESAPSNSVTPAGSGPTTLAADTFTRADSATTLGTSSGGQVWSAPEGTWGITGNRAYLPVNGGGSYNVAYLDAGQSAVTYTVDLTPRSGDIDLGLCALVQDADNLIFWDLSGSTLGGGTNITTRLFHRIGGGTFTGITSAATVTLAAGTTYALKMVVGPTTIGCYIDNTLVFASAGATGLESQTRFGLVVASGAADHSSTFDNLLIST